MFLQDDANSFLKMVQDVNSSNDAKVEKVDAELMKKLAYGSRGDLSPMNAVIGGITAQEVMKVGS